jgi:predicted Zn-dependent protease with MMP-like domain
MTRREFEKLAQAGIAAIPARFRAKLNNVAIVIENRPSKQQLQHLGVDKDHTLLGLYEGVPQTARWNYGEVPPDKITLFQKPIEEAAQDTQEIPEIVKETVWHEIAHHFGMEEDEIRRKEHDRKHTLKGKRLAS